MECSLVPRPPRSSFFCSRRKTYGAFPTAAKKSCKGKTGYEAMWNFMVAILVMNMSFSSYWELYFKATMIRECRYFICCQSDNITTCIQYSLVSRLHLPALLFLCTLILERTSVFGCFYKCAKSLGSGVWKRSYAMRASCVLLCVHAVA